MNTRKRIISLALTLCLTLGLAAPAMAAESAAAIRLSKTTGTVSVSKSSGKSLTLLSNMRLYNGYHVATETESYAWMNLDDVKLVKEDAASEAEVRKDGRKLTVNLCSGSLFFDVSEELEDDESLNISTSTMIVGIRGTSGYVRVTDRWTTILTVLEGTVQCSVADPVTGQIKTETVRGGETVTCVVYPQDRPGDKCDILRKKLTLEEIPGFVLTELVRDVPLCDKIRDETGLDILEELAVTAGGDPSGRTPDQKTATPEVLDEADRREEEGEEELRKKLEELEKSGETPSPDKVFSQRPEEPPPESNSADGLYGGSNSSGSSPKPSQTARGMKLRDVEVQALLAEADAAAIQPNTDAADTTPKKNILEVDTGLSVDAGKTLTLQPGIDVEVYPDKTLRVDGTLSADNLANNGVTVVASGNTLRLRGNLTTAGTMDVTATGRIVVDGVFTRTGTLTLASGAAVLAKAFAQDAAPRGWEVSAGADADGYYRLVPAETLTVQFNANGGSWAGGSTVTEAKTEMDSVAAFPADPVRTGYVFVGWYDAPTGGNPVTASQTFTADTTVYAHWAQVFTVAFDHNDGTGAVETARTPGGGGTVAFPASPTRAGYIFAGWYDAPAGGNPAAADRVFTADTTLYAHWTRETPDPEPEPAPTVYTVTFDHNDGTGAAETAQIPDGGGTVAFPADPVRAGYAFDGWYDAPTGGTQVAADRTFTANTTVYAHWTQTIFTVTFDYNDGTGAAETAQTPDGGGTVTFPADPVRTGYFFAGWYDDPTNGTRVETDQTFTADTMVYARWDPFIEWTFNATGGEFSNGDTTATMVVTALAGSGPWPVDPTYPDSASAGADGGSGAPALTFVGWFDASGNQYNEPAHFDWGPMELFAYWDGWYLDDAGKLTVAGNGPMEDCYTASESSPDVRPPWADSSGDVLTVEVKKGVTSIGDSAFANCSSLTSITIPDSVTSIGDSAFANCSSLTSITIPDSVTSIGGSAFANCSSLTSITIPDGVTSIENNVFDGCSSLTSVTIPDSVTSIGAYAFRSCSGLDSITIPDSVKSMGLHAFFGCSSLTSVAIPDGVESIESSTFRGCSNLTSVTIPDSVTSIGDSAFYGCSSLTSITIPDGVTSIRDSTFQNCSNLTSVTIPNRVTSIGYSAFRDCSNLTSVTIPDSVTSMGSHVFAQCSSLTSIAIPDGVTSIEGFTFYGCSRLTSVTIPDGVTSIGDDAFYECSSLTSIKIPDGVTSIGDSVFWGCSSLTSITIPDGVTSIGNYAFRECSGLTSVTIPDNVTSIGAYAFAHCNNLTGITIPGSVASIGNDVFYDCGRLSTIEFGGTQAEWTARAANASVRSGVNVICSDGTITTT